ncbi:ribonuclease H-like domain-containing protein [Roridomyces roridus]|uniref:Ribonuclease H-like domain-containing protein n=1 Tax=Roridomyces roridus TaxID=1738132 RepID=A0AAD7FGC1_9AGAR|nr:ribonuclease H-like domain-containing protein [Roridomyces roridus]
MSAAPAACIPALPVPLLATLPPTKTDTAPSALNDPLPNSPPLALPPLPDLELFPAPVFICVNTIELAETLLARMPAQCIIAVDIECKMDPNAVIRPSKKRKNRSKAKHSAKIQAHAHAIDKGTFLIDWDGLKTRLVQVAVRGEPVWGFDLAQIRALPGRLRDLLESADVLKVGVNINCDVVQLWYDLGVETKNVADVGLMAAPAYPEQLARGGARCPGVGLDTICRQLFNRRLDKNLTVSGWTGELDEKQWAYAATDAHVTLLAYELLAFVHVYSGYTILEKWYTWDSHRGARVGRGTQRGWDTQCPWWNDVNIGFDPSKRV